jgi:hypothetical protein
MYKLVKDRITNETNMVSKQVENGMAYIPFDPANTDFIEYQKWLELGNTPLPAENE